MIRGAVPLPGAELRGVQCLAQAAIGLDLLALQLAGGAGFGRLPAQVLMQQGVVDGDGSLRGEGFHQRLAFGMEHTRIGMTVEQAAQQLARSDVDGDREIAARWMRAGRKRGERTARTEMRIFGDVRTTDRAVAEEGPDEAVIDVRQGEVRRVFGRRSGYLDQRAGRAVSSGNGVEERAPLRVAQLAAGVEGGLHNRIHVAFAGKHQAGVHQQL